MKRVMPLILVIKYILLKRVDRTTSWQQLSQVIDIEMIQKGQVVIFKMDEIKHLMSKKDGPK